MAPEIPWRDGDNRTRWAPPEFLPPTDSTVLYLVNPEEVSSGVPMVRVNRPNGPKPCGAGANARRSEKPGEGFGACSNPIGACLDIGRVVRC